MNKIYLLIALLFVGIRGIDAQQHVHNERCGHNIYMNAMENSFPGYKEAVNRTFEEARVRGAASDISNRNVYTIKTVVHIVWKEPAENISDAIIDEQIAALNEDFNATNPDYINLRSEFSSIAGNPQIEFDLVHVERVQTTETFEQDLADPTAMDYKLKKTANGGSDAWDTDEYLNIWVCNIQPLTIFGIPLGQVLGVATPPVNLADYPDLNNFPPEILDAFSDATINGVTIHYPIFGGRGRMINDPLLGGAMNLEGRTATHEVGHYLGLRHIWGDPEVNPLTGEGEDGCIVDDGIMDTPNAQDNSQQSGCLATKNTCIDTSLDLPDMWENYMDYSSETCQVAFTQGQVDIIRGVLEGPRFSLIDGVVSIEESTTLAQNVKVQPNPTTGLVMLNIDFDDNETYQYTVKDMLGREIMAYREENGSRNIELDLSSFANGVYFIEITKGNNRFAKKVVLSK